MWPRVAAGSCAAAHCPEIGPVGGVLCDRERITQLLSNLIANALDHGDPQGEVKVRAALADGSFILSVHNQGPPIAPQLVPLLFQPFSRPLSGAPRQGLGLGLYIANQIALAHGGHMQVTSSASGGTLFSLHLPLARPATATTPSASS